jgi:predicted metal-dependent phosphoesterase TrpH
MKAIIHLHSWYSFDCLVSPKWIVDRAVKNGVDLLCITDHDSIKGAVKAKEYARKKYGNKIEVIIGAEYYTNLGDIVVLNIQGEYEERDAVRLIENVKRDGGFVLFPHPYKGHTKIEELALLSDAIEIFNARCSENDNARAAVLAAQYNKPTYVASDAHFLNDMLRCINISGNEILKLDDFLYAEKEFQVSYSDRKAHILSQLIKGVKQGDIKLIYGQSKSLLLNTLSIYAKQAKKYLLLSKN